MNARGSTEVIVATIGLSMGALSQNLFTMIVTMAVVTTMAMPPTLRWALSSFPMRKDEKQRLEREEMEAKGFVPKLERLLLTVDESNNAKLATRIAGLMSPVPRRPYIRPAVDAYQKTSRQAKPSERPPTQRRSRLQKSSGKTVQEFAQSVERCKSPMKRPTFPST